MLLQQVPRLKNTSLRKTDKRKSPELVQFPEQIKKRIKITFKIKETGVRLGRRSLQPAVLPADGHLTTPTVAGLPGLFENFHPTAPKR